MTEAAPATLYLVDGSALAYRSHFAFIRNPLVTRQGETVSAIFGFTAALLRILEKDHPTHLAVVFDTKDPTFRHAMYAEYKATRQKMPEELEAQLAGIRDVLAALNVPVLVHPGYEADDVIGTLAQRAEASGTEVRIVTADKDFCQIVTPRIKLYTPGKGDGEPEIIGPDEVPGWLGVRPDQVVDLLSLMGDTSDNVPGVPKVGWKTAVDLLTRFGSLDRLYAQIEEVTKPALKRNLVEHRADALLSRELVTLHCDLEIPLTLADFARLPADPAATRQLFQRYEFRSLLDRVPDAGAAANAPIDRRYRLIRGGPELRDLIAELRSAGFFAIDTETTGIDPLKAELVGISFCARPGLAAYVPFREPGTGLFQEASGATGIEKDPAFPELRALLADPTVRKAGQNAKYDLHVLARHGLPVEGLAFDSMVAHYCVAPSAASHSLDALALQYFDHVKIKTTDLIGTGRKQVTMDRVPVERVCEYACEDADFAFRVIEPLRSQMQAAGVLELYERLELPLVHVLRRMEAAGARLDPGVLEKMGPWMRARLDELEKQIHALADEPFNVRSPQQLAAVLFDKLKVHEKTGARRLPRTSTGYSTDAEVLEQMRNEPIVAAILEYRQLDKLRGSYIDLLPALVHPRTGKLHTSFNQTVAATGRLSSSDPNLQQIPIRTELGREIRRAFVSSHEGGTLISADYSQIELRLLAHVSDDEQLVAAFSRDEDIHRRTASLVFRVPIDQVEPVLRNRAKAINFGIIYGMGPQRLARETGLTFPEAQEFIARYFGVFTGVRRWLDQTLEQAQRDGFVTTLLGRRRAIPEIQSQDPRIQAAARNVAVNTPLQGTAADLIKLAMLAVDREILAADLRSRMILQVHDELVFDVAPGESEVVRQLARRCMEGALDLRVPLKVEIGEGRTWLDAH